MKRQQEQKLTNAQRELVEQNIPLAAMLAGRAASRFYGVNFEDLLQAALLQFCKSALKHDPEVAKFTSFAGNSASLALITEAKRSTLIRLPYSMPLGSRADASRHATPASLEHGTECKCDPRDVRAGSDPTLFVERSHDVQLYLSWLKPRHRAVVELWMHGRSGPEISRKLRVSKNRVHQILKMAIATIRARLREDV